MTITLTVISDGKKVVITQEVPFNLSSLRVNDLDIIQYEMNQMQNKVLTKLNEAAK